MTGNKLLVADDSLTIQKVIRLALSNEGYEIQAVSDGNDAIQQISVFRPNVVLVDVSLPGQSAFQLKRAINLLPDLNDVRFVLMSSAFEKVDESQISDVVFQGRLTKPFDPAHLRQVLLDVLSLPPSPKANPSPTTSPAKISLIPPNEADFETDESEVSIDISSDLSLLEPSPATIVNEEKTSLIEDLWEPEPIAIPPPTTPRSSDDDIRELTQSTIKMSGLEDFQWTVNESAKKSLPEEPLPVSSTFTPNEFNFDDFQEEKSPVPPPSPMGADQDPIAIPELNNDARIIPLTDHQAEELVSRQLREVLERMAKDILPDLAERLLKQEIHRMLSEQP